ncbi:hypothetical protein GUY44_07570 [Pimelobacter simplex]|uniref:Phage protein n=1 Tax=Nocardioides simplex TaxID=2045 RepID=A0A0A1DKB2_NOCSI|nr:hypothetical protein [Pimelobacter simplex]AIY15815.1 Phage protein [Pimelobacter simplex]MCG8150333.1 hypothetical protein [Pimelobacter simplex]GEB16699.1 hypothetical protein NSI01_50140 [Pimelobacter simplex]SFM89835.1 hypothetical protein SAMN05421671_4085 [Pimelobacter simplex]
MGRSRASAKSAGTRFERSIADCLARHVDDRIDRRGDIGGLRISSAIYDQDQLLHPRVVVECKDVARLNLAGWVDEADIERGNDDALIGLVVHKRRGTADPLDQYVTTTLRDLIALLTGERP